MSNKTIEVLNVLAKKLDKIKEEGCKDGEITKVYFISGIVKALEEIYFLIDILEAEYKNIKKES